ncbi:MAG: thioredoxin [Eubacterium sp.]|nr:thioredoxin [Eubacterium sp.]
MVKKINTEEFKAMDKAGVSVVDFNATWCGPCKMLAPVLEELSNDLEGKASFYAVDTDENPELAQEFRITSIPAVAVIKDGTLQDMHVGFVPKPQLLEFIQKYL